LIAPPRLPLYLVDVRDVAKAHVRAIQVEACANQRYICVATKDLWVSDAARILKKYFPNYPIMTVPPPDFVLHYLPGFIANKSEALLFGKENTGHWFKLNNSKTKKDMGIEFTDLEVSLRDTAKSMIEFALVPKSTPLGPVNMYLLAIGVLLIAIFVIVCWFFM
jgi:dihydroflavonol-4-reductase